MIGCDIKFVDKEKTPFGGLSLFFKMLEQIRFLEHLEKCGLPAQVSNRGYIIPIVLQNLTQICKIRLSKYVFLHIDAISLHCVYYHPAICCESIIGFAIPPTS